ncbi:MAG: hypothetical protein UH850_13990 [Paludibacteraceae bacterium]|nr:hypothetical protein [Paludibacteraceae bacterium]
MFGFKRLYYFLFLSILLNSCFNEVSQSNSNEQSDSIQWHHFNYGLGYLNGDRFLDSVELAYRYREEHGEWGMGRISVFFGTENGKYNLFKTYYCDYYWDELGIYISGDTLGCTGYGETYNFKYKNEDFYLVEYEFLDMGAIAKYKLDFENNKMTFVIDLEDGIKRYDTVYYRSIEIPHGKIPESYSIPDCFKKEFHKQYIHYDSTFLCSKIKKYVDEINENFDGEEDDEKGTSKSIEIDNDTVLAFSYEIKGMDSRYYTYSLSMTIDRKGLTAQLKEILETEMCAMLAKDNNYVYNNVTDAYNARKIEWENEFDIEKDLGGYIDDYFIRNIGTCKDLITYNIGTYHCDQCYGRGMEDERFITYNKNTGQPFTWNMIKKEDGLHELMVEGLMKYYRVNSVDEMWVNENYQKGEYIPFPKNPPFVINDSLVLQFHRFEITDVWGAGWPSASIALDKVLPYLTDEGKLYLKIND